MGPIGSAVSIETKPGLYIVEGITIYKPVNQNVTKFRKKFPQPNLNIEL